MATRAARMALAALACTALLPLGAAPAPAQPEAARATADLSRSAAGVSTWKVTTSARRSVALLYMNPAFVKFRFVPGTQVPGGYSSRLDSPSTFRSRMVAAFNGGFLLSNSEGGYYFRGRTYQGLQRGKASLVIDKAGRLNVVRWGGGSPSAYSVVRQNLTLLVDGGRSKVGTRGNGCDSWGAVGNKNRHCPGERSAVGVTAFGNVVYAYGYRVYASDLAEALIKAGAVRAMMLEMNASWPSAYTYSGGRGARIDGGISDGPSRYTTGWKRDFIVALTR